MLNLADLSGIGVTPGDAINQTYAFWDAEPGNPLAANYVASSIKALIYNRARQYPNLRYLVIVGDDRIIPHRRIRDEAVIANERLYATTAGATTLAGSLELRFFLSDDYYAGLLPLRYKGREVYLPQLALGRLVETPDEIATTIQVALEAGLTLNPGNHLVTGYDFLIDAAQGISGTLSSYGVGPEPQNLVNDTWQKPQFTAALGAEAPDLVSLNSHFTHYFFYPNGPNTVGNYVFALSDIISGPTSFAGSLIFSVGCHSGLNVPDGSPYAAGTLGAMDWAQAFAQHKTLGFIGNTGFGYGDSDVIAYSELIMNNFAEELGYQPNGQPRPVGAALARAKLRYFNTAAADSFSNYDEKALGIMTLYGLPMLRVDVPKATGTPPGGLSVVAAPGAPEGPTSVGAQATFTASLPLNFSYQPKNYSLGGQIIGQYFEITGDPQAGLQTDGGKPILPVTSRSISVTDFIAHGALLLGGTFQDIPNFNPAVSLLITDDVAYLNAEPPFPFLEWTPGDLGAVNRLLTIDGQTNDRLVVTPMQFRATTLGTPTTGTARLYSSLKFDLYYAPETDVNFAAPGIWQVSATPPSGGQVTFTALVNDDLEQVQRVLVLYRPLTGHTWLPFDLTYDPETNQAGGTLTGQFSAFEFIVQAVDGSGNVALSLDQGNPYVVYNTLYLPLVRR